ncbi:MAG: DUF2007 domain-containing protein [Gammaproteobacteria bacterium]
MKKVYVNENRMLAGYALGILESHNIEAFMKNDHLTGGIGELPVNECWPEVWIQDDSCYEQALGIINDLLDETRSASAWRCPNCNEQVEGQFGECWNCGAEAPK